MPNATISSSTQTASLTQAKVVAGIKTGMLAAGYTQASETPGTSHVIWFTRVFNAGATYGTVAVRFTVDSTGGTVSLATSYSTTGNLATTSITLTTSQDVTIYAVNHAEISGIIFVQGTSAKPVLIYRPSNKPTWFNENSFLYAWWTGTGSSISSTGQPTAIGLTSVGALVLTTNPPNTNNPLDSNQYQIWTLSGLISAQGFLGEFSADVVFATRPVSIKPSDTLIVTAGVEEYFVVDNFHAVRTV